MAEIRAHVLALAARFRHMCLRYSFLTVTVLNPKVTFEPQLRFTVTKPFHLEMNALVTSRNKAKKNS